jgi:uncharacterized repeat protein (TIGR03803 family)
MILGMAALGPGLSASQAQILVPPPVSNPFQTSPYTMLHNFDCIRYPDYHYGVEGCNEPAPNFLAQGRDGNLYGTAAQGGSLGTNASNFSEGGGTIFKIDPTVKPVPFTPIYTFGTNAGMNMVPDGSEPKSGLTLGMDGVLYGTARQGGANKKGSVFSFSSSGFSSLSSFTDGMDGGFPEASPVLAPDGNLYGVTNTGTTARGVIYRITPTSGFSVIFTLGVDTTAPLVFGFDGNLYGTTQTGYADAQGVFHTNGGQGTIFRLPLSSSGTVNPTFLHNFAVNTLVPSTTGQQVADGSVPKGPVMIGQDGNLYGTASSGGSTGHGVIYQFNPNTAKYKVVYAFPLVTVPPNIANPPPPDVNGRDPESGLVQGSDGFLFGVTVYGGRNGVGTLFKVDTAGANFQVLWHFGNPIQCPNNVVAKDGAYPYSTPTLHTNGRIFGMTQKGGCRSDYGTIYSFDAGLKPFISIVGGSRWVNVGSKVGVLGQGFTSATGVFLGNSTTPLGKLAVQVFSDTYMEVTVPQLLGRTHIAVQLPSGRLTSPQFICTTPPRGVTSLC